MLKLSIAIKSRALPLCDCGIALDKFKGSYPGSPYYAPTHVNGDTCIFCEHHVYWEPGYTPYCNCEEVCLIHKGKKFEYLKNQTKEDVISRSQYPLPDKYHRYKQPTETLKTRCNHCKFCGSIVEWRKY